MGAVASKRILIIAPEPFYEDRGTPIAVRHVLEGLSASGRAVDLVTYPIGKAVELPGLRIIRGPNPFGFRWVPIGLSLRKVVLDLALLPKIVRLIRTGEYAYVHALEEAAFAASAVAGPRGVPLVYDMQSSLPEQLTYLPFFRARLVQRLLRRTERWLLRRATTIVCSAGLSTYVRERVPDAEVREWLFPTSLDGGVPLERGRALVDLGIDPGSKVVVYTGNFEQYQGLSRLLNAVPLVAARVPGVVFLLIGAERPERHDLFGLYADQLREGRIVIVERQPRERIREFLALGDVLVSPRDSVSNVPIKVFEYMETGRPIVASDCDAHRSVLDQDRAILVGPAPTDWADAIVELLENPQRAASLAGNALNYARQRLSRKTFRKMVLALYDGESEALPARSQMTSQTDPAGNAAPRHNQEDSG